MMMQSCSNLALSAACLSLFLQPASVLAQSKPTVDVIANRVSKKPGSTVRMVTGTGLRGNGEIWIDQVNVLQIGAFNVPGKHWPVEVCVAGIASKGDKAPAERYSARVRYEFKVNDFGEWTERELTPAQNATAASLACDASVSVVMKITESERFDSYVEPGTVKKDGYLRSSLILSNLKARNPQGALSQTYVMEYDCKGERFRSLSMRQHSGQMGTGDIIEIIRNGDTTWQALTPGAPIAASFKFVCALGNP